MTWSKASVLVLEEELQALRRDAERYRWLRSHGMQLQGCQLVYSGVMLDIRADLGCTEAAQLIDVQRPGSDGSQVNVPPINALPDPSVEEISSHTIMFLTLRDSGSRLTEIAVDVAELHGISLEQLKTECLKAAHELIAARGRLLAIEQPVYDWART